MIFTALRKFENSDCSTEYTCTGIDFENALAIVQTYLQHSILMFNNLPKQGDSMQFQGGGDKRKLFEALPSNAFQRKEAVEIAKQFNLSARTVDNFLKTSLGKTLESPKTGFYKKI